MFKFSENYLPGPNKFLCDGWCCGYAPVPRDPREPAPTLSAEEQARIEELKQTKVFSQCYFETLDEIYEALDYELVYCISVHKVREVNGQFTFKGKTYSYARVFNFERDEAWIEIKDEDGSLLYGKDSRQSPLV